MDRSTAVTVSSILKSLVAEDFRNRVAFANTPFALRAVLLTTPEVKNLRADLASGAVTDTQIRQFVDYIMPELRRDERFAEDFALAAIAVAFETHHSTLAEEFLRDLAGLRLRELSMATGVAREALRNRFSMTVETRTLTVTSLDGSKLPVGSKRLEPQPEQTKNTLVTYERAAA